MSSRPSDTFLLVDALRGVAALGVVAFHASLSVLRNHPELASHPPALLAAMRYGALGVEVFFVLSGFCIATAIAKTLDTGRTPVDYAKARLRRILPPYWATLAITLAAVAGMRPVVAAGWVSRSSLADQAARLDPATFAANIGLVQVPLHLPSIVSVSWTLSYECAFYAVLGALVFPFARAAGPRRFAPVHIATIGSLVWTWWPGGRPGWPMDLWPAFGAGVAVHDILSRSKDDRPAWLGLATLCAVGTLAGLRHPVGLEPREPIPFVVAAGATVLLLLLARRSDRRTGKWPILAMLRRVGTFSYSLYLVHFLCIGLVGQVLGRARLPTTMWWIEFLAMALASVAAAWGFHVLVERRFLSSSARTSSAPGSPR